MTTALNMDDSAIVVAHPDDEILWFGSLVCKVNRIVMCFGANPQFPKRALQRRQVVEDYPFRGIEFLDIPEPVEDWTVESRGNRSQRGRLLDQLRRSLGGIRTVFTHNPWGEYGHRHHRSVHAVMGLLARELEIEVFVSGYASVGALAQCSDVLRHGVARELASTTDRDVIRKIQSLYVENSCWTWQRTWNWPDREHFYVLGSSEFGRDRVLPLQLILPPWQMSGYERAPRSGLATQTGTQSSGTHE